MKTPLDPGRTSTPLTDPMAATSGADAPMQQTAKCPCCGQSCDPGTAMPQQVTLTVNSDGTMTIAPESEADEPAYNEAGAPGVGAGDDEQAMIGQAAGGGVARGGI